MKFITTHFSSVHMKTWPSEKAFDSFPKSELAYRFKSQFTGALFEILHICKSIWSIQITRLGSCNLRFPRYDSSKRSLNSV